MLKILMKLVKGDFVWKCLCIKHRITNSTLILILSGENKKIDEYTLKYLNQIMDRKRCDKALILVGSMESNQLAHYFVIPNKFIKIVKIPNDKINSIYYWYRIVRFNKNIFFTYTDKTKDNLLGKFIRETNINENDAVCLAIYNFRTVLEED